MTPDLRLLLVRHGHAEANRPWVFLGHTDSPLSKEGQSQGEMLAARLVQEPIRAVYSSPLQRALQTAQVVARLHCLTPCVDERLIEQQFGEWEGLTLDDVQQQFGEDVLNWQADAVRCGPTGGETLGDVATRVHAFIADVRCLHPAETILVVAHGGVLNVLLCTLLKTPLSWLWAYRLQVGTVSELLLYGERATLLRLSDDLGECLPSL